jgi:hypothetical protein
MRKAKLMDAEHLYTINLTGHPMDDGRIYLNGDMPGYTYVLDPGEKIDAVIPNLIDFASLYFQRPIRRIRATESARAANENEIPYTFVAEAAVLADA